MGIENVAALWKGFALLVCCGKCGAIHGVIAVPDKRVRTLEEPQKTPTDIPTNLAKARAKPPAQKITRSDPLTFPPPPGLLALAGSTDISLAPISPDDARQRIKMVTMFHGGQKHINVLGETGICSTCNCEMVKMTIPAGYQNSGQVIYYCPNYEQCGQWYFVFFD